MRLCEPKIEEEVRVNAHPIPVICIVGPTAVGKTALSLELALRFCGEIISADSMQVYRYMDIGTAKLPVSDRRQVAHHMIDVVDPRDHFTVHDYVSMARPVIDQIAARGHVPIVVGGTGLYVRSLIDHYDLTSTARNDELRAELAREAEQYGSDHLHARLRDLDAVSADRIHPNDVRRIVRALEIVTLSGKTVAENYAAKESNLQPLMIGLTLDRDKLYTRIDQRVDDMMENGLLNEVRMLRDIGCHASLTSMQAIGYKELFGVLEGRHTLDVAVALIKQASRRYAKRQLSWFRTDSRIVWYEFQEDDIMDAMSSSGVLQDVSRAFSKLG